YLEMASYFDEHPQEADPLGMARLLLDSGLAMEFGLTLERLFPDGRPTTQKELDALPRITVEESKKENEPCPICMALFGEEKDARLIEMPCKHIFHEKCILTWLKQMNSCPSCRQKMADPVEEEWKRQEKRRVERERDLEELHDSMYG
ncbi:hypothetical protein PFISCL1PPCAC_23746, partial [Pristionchus fissidentatus]